MKFIITTYLILTLTIAGMVHFGTDAERWQAQNQEGINELIQERNNEQ